LNDIRFEWDSVKAARNVRKHRISFEEAITVWSDPNAYFEDDWRHSESEDRGRVIGFSEKDHLLAVIFTVRADVIRIINARKVTAAEEATYAQGFG